MNVDSCILFYFAFFEVLRLVFLTTENNTKMFHLIDAKMRSLQTHIQKIWPGVTHNKPLGLGYECGVGNDKNIITTFIKSRLYAKHFARNVFCSVPSFPRTHSWKQCCSHFHFLHVRSLNPQTPKGMVSLYLVTLCCQTPN